MRITAFDLATITGIASSARGRNLPALWHLKIGKKNCELGEFLLSAHTQYRAVLSDEAPEAVVFESPTLRNTTSLITARKLYGLAGVLEMICEREKIPCYETSILEVKKELCGHAHAEKDHQIRAAKLLGFDPKTSDEADALGVYLCGLRKLSPDEHRYWHDKRDVFEFSSLQRDIVAFRKARKSKKSELK